MNFAQHTRRQSLYLALADTATFTQSIRDVIVSRVENVNEQIRVLQLTIPHGKLPITASLTYPKHAGFTRHL